MSAGPNDRSDEVLCKLGWALVRSGLDATTAVGFVKAVNSIMPMQSVPPAAVDDIARELDSDATGGSASRARHLRLVSARVLWPFRQPEWLQRPYIPKGELTLLEGREGVGKGLFAAWLAKQLADQVVR